ncbi:MAG: YggT family protein [Acidimicrobiia bacterium]
MHHRGAVLVFFSGNAVSIICYLLQLYVVCLIVRAVLSWFPPSRSGFMATVNEFLYAITEPLLAPLRRIIPPLGGLDLSFLVLMFGSQIIISIVCPGRGIL